MTRLHRLWPWLIAAVAVAVGVWMLLGRRATPALPVPDRELSGPPPREEIQNSERQRLHEILERKRSRQ